MDRPEIDKPTHPSPPPVMADWQAAREGFHPHDLWAGIDGLPDGGLNIAHECVARHANGPGGSRTAIRWRSRSASRDISYAELHEMMNRFANVLADLGVARGDRVFSLAGRVPELYAAALGTLAHGAVFCPLFSAFGPEPVKTRIEGGDGKVLVTTESLYRRKIAPIRDQLPLEHVLVLGRAGRPVDLPGVIDLHRAMEEASPDHEIAHTSPGDLALLHFTSGTTGKPKGAMHGHDAVRWHHFTGRYALDLSPDAVYWCTADPGWVTGTSYGFIAPLAIGCTLVIDREEFDAVRWYELLAREGVTHWYTAPTAIRMLMRVGADQARSVDLSALRFVASVGEPLNPEAVVWGQEVLGLPIHDNWWQSETGGIAIANYRATPIRPGSMGRPMPGIEAAIVRRTDDAVEVIDTPDVEGELALAVGWPSMFRGYLHMSERYEACFAGGWYLTGDLARRDADGCYWFVGRADDVIKSAGHLIGPFEVESALVEHAAVAEAAAIGAPDPVAGSIVKAFVALNPGFSASDDLIRELIAHARRRLGPAVAPREIAVLPELPHTRSGKIMRRLLKARELGLPEGDTSTLENP